MGAITILLCLLLAVIIIIDWRKTVIIVDMRQKLDRAQAEIRALESKLLDATTKPIRICEACAIYPCKCE